LADNDVILKLAQCDLLDDLVDWLTEDHDKIYVTKTAQYQLLIPSRPAKALERAGSPIVLERIRSFLTLTDIVPVAKDETLLTNLFSVEGIDDGEAMLFVGALEQEDPLLITGDRRALKSLINHQHLPDIKRITTALHGRVVTFESSILLALEKLGYAVVQQKLLSSPSPDGMLRLALSQQCESNLRECLISYSKDVSLFLAFQS
jgi:hypothetical protein